MCAAIEEPHQVYRDFVHRPVDKGLASGRTGLVTDESYLFVPSDGPFRGSGGDIF